VLAFAGAFVASSTISSLVNSELRNFCTVRAVRNPGCFQQIRRPKMVRPPHSRRLGRLHSPSRR
jgi:hypothetical protein